MKAWLTNNWLLIIALVCKWIVAIGIVIIVTLAIYKTDSYDDPIERGLRAIALAIAIHAMAVLYGSKSDE